MRHIPIIALIFCGASYGSGYTQTTFVPDVSPQVRTSVQFQSAIASTYRNSTPFYSRWNYGGGVDWVSTASVNYVQATAVANISSTTPEQVMNLGWANCYLIPSYTLSYGERLMGYRTPAYFGGIGLDTVVAYGDPLVHVRDCNSTSYAESGILGERVVQIDLNLSNWVQTQGAVYLNPPERQDISTTRSFDGKVGMAWMQLSVNHTIDPYVYLSICPTTSYQNNCLIMGKQKIDMRDEVDPVNPLYCVYGDMNMDLGIVSLTDLASSQYRATQDVSISCTNPVNVRLTLLSGDSLTLMGPNSSYADGRIQINGGTTVTLSAEPNAMFTITVDKLGLRGTATAGEYSGSTILLTSFL